MGLAVIIAAVLLGLFVDHGLCAIAKAMLIHKYK
jgi:hypothetical protein